MDPEHRLAMVRHCKPGVYDFWVAPGGGVEHGEDIKAAAKREAFEETGLVVEPEKLIAIEQMMGSTSGTHHVKFWYFAGYGSSPQLGPDECSKSRELISEARWLSRAEFADKMFFPPILNDMFWTEFAAGFPTTTILPVRVMRFE